MGRLVVQSLTFSKSALPAQRVCAVCSSILYWTFYFAGLSRFRRLAREYEKVEISPTNLAGLHKTTRYTRNYPVLRSFVAHDGSMKGRWN